jgi:hypothetical protein
MVSKMRFQTLLQAVIQLMSAGPDSAGDLALSRGNFAGSEAGKWQRSNSTAAFAQAVYQALAE